MIVNAKLIGPVNPRDYLARDHSVKRGGPGFFMTRSTLHDFATCPAKWIKGWKSEENDSMAYGGLLDCLWLTPDRFEKDYAVCPETYPDSKTGEPKPWTLRANYCKEWEEQQHKSGKEVVRAKDHEEAVAALRTLPNFIRDASTSQVMVVGEFCYESVTVPIRCLIDLVPNRDSERYGKSLMDLKTARCAAPRAWERSVFDLWYHVQAALELDLYTAATGEDRCEFRHIVQENTEPHHVEYYLLSQEWIELGRRTYLDALKQYCQCIVSGEWPGYSRPGETDIDGWKLSEPEPWMIV